MFTKIKLSVAAAFIKSTLNSLATDKNTQTSVAGVLAGAVLAIRGLDLAKLLEGDPQQIALAISSLAVALVGFLAGKENHDGHTTLLGVLAGASQAYVGNITAALTVALCGYLTNKTVAASTPAPPSGTATAAITGAPAPVTTADAHGIARSLAESHAALMARPAKEA